MERAPLPQHERSWRHPSELAALERAAVQTEEPRQGARVVALLAGTLGLFAVGALVMTVTPRRHDSPIAISATTTPLLASGQLVGPAAGTRPAGFADRTLAAAASTALATPFGDDGLAFVTSASLLASGTAARGRLDVVVPSGRSAVARIVRSGDAPLAIVSLGDVNERTYAFTTRRPTAREMVTVLASPPLSVEFADVGSLDVAEGTAVIDQDGDLVGLCSHGGRHGRVSLILVSDLIVGATTDDR